MYNLKTNCHSDFSTQNLKYSHILNISKHMFRSNEDLDDIISSWYKKAIRIRYSDHI